MLDEFKFTECVSFYKIRKILGFSLEARSDFKITLKLKLNMLLSTMVTIMVAMCFV